MYPDALEQIILCEAPAPDKCGLKQEPKLKLKGKMVNLNIRLYFVF